MNNPFVHVKARPEDEKMVFRVHLGTVTHDEKTFDMSTNHKGLGLMLERDGFIVGLDVEKIIKYICNNWEELIK